MFALGVIALVLETAMWFLTAEPDFDVSNGDTLYAGCYYVWANYYILTPVQYILCDAICAWRTVVLWDHDKRVVSILVFSIIGTTGT